jgi:hypothetical protein
MRLNYDRKLAALGNARISVFAVLVAVLAAVASGCAIPEAISASQPPTLPIPTRQRSVVAVMVESPTVETASLSFSTAAPLSPATNLSASAVESVTAPMSYPPSLNTVSLAWNRANDQAVIGYAVYYRSSTNSNYLRANVGNSTNAVIDGLTVGVPYQIHCVSYDAGGNESVPSNEVTAMVPAVTSMRIGSWIIESKGATYRTNVMQSSSDLTNWSNVLTWVGDGTNRAHHHTNQSFKFFRTVPR